jgi:hypothetical protein
VKAIRRRCASIAQAGGARQGSSRRAAADPRDPGRHRGLDHSASFPRPLSEAGTSLERYAARFNAAEINSTFYGMHKRETFERWAASVPDGFRFSVKLPKAITHERRLADCAALLAPFLEAVGVLGPSSDRS